MDAKLSQLDDDVIADFVYGVSGGVSKKIAPGSMVQPPDALDISFTGAWDYDYPFNIVPRQAFQHGVDGRFADDTGVWINEFTYASPKVNQLTSLSFNNLTGVSGVFSPTTLPSLTSLGLPELLFIGGNFQPSSMNALTSLDLPNLVACEGGFFNPSTMNSVTSFSAPNLERVKGFYAVNASNVTSYSVPKLRTIGGQLSSSLAALKTFDFPSLEFIGGGWNSALASATSFRFPKLRTVVGGNILINACPQLATLNLPSLSDIVGNFNPLIMTGLTSISLPALKNISGSVTLSNQTASVANFTMPPIGVLKNGGSGWTLSSCALNQASVDSILMGLAALDGQYGTTAFSSKTVTITGTSSTPSAVGLAAKAVLQARGCTVTNN